MHRDGAGAADGSHGHDRHQQVAVAEPTPDYQADRAGDPSRRFIYYGSFAFVFVGEAVRDGASNDIVDRGSRCGTGTGSRGR